MGSSQTATSNAIHPADRITLWAIAAISLVFAGAWLVVTAIRAIGPALFDQPVVVDLLVADARTDTTPVEGVVRSQSEVEVVTIEVDAFGAGAIAQIVGTSALEALIIAVVAAVIGVAIIRLGQGRPFQRSLFWMGVTAGGAMAIGGLIVEGLGVGGRMMLAHELNYRLGTDHFVVGGSFDPTPIGIGFVVIALASIVLIGERLQRDTEGLV